MKVEKLKPSSPHLTHNFKIILARTSVLSALCVLFVSSYLIKNNWTWQNIFVLFIVLSSPFILMLLQTTYYQIIADHFTNKYRKSSDFAHLDRAANAWIRYAKLINFPEQKPNPLILDSWNDAAGVLFDRYLQAGVIDDLVFAIGLMYQTVEITPANSEKYAERLNLLGYFMQVWHTHTGDFEVLDNSIELLEKAALVPIIDQSKKAKYLSDLSVAYVKKYTRLGTNEYLQKAIRYAESATGLMSPDLSSNSNLLYNLGVVLYYKYTSTSKLSDLDRAVELIQQAKTHLAPNSTNLPSLLGELGPIFLAKYKHTGQLTDLQGGISTLQDSIKEMSDKNVNKPAQYSNLGLGQLYLYQRTKKIDDLENSIESLRIALETSPDTFADKAIYSANLSGTLYRRYLINEDPSDLKEGIELLKESFQKAPVEALSQNILTTNLGLGNLFNYFSTNNPDDLNSAIEFLGQAFKTCPEESPMFTQLLVNMGSIQQLIFNNSADTADMQKGINYFREGCQKGILNSPEDSLRGSALWGKWALDRESWEEAIEAFTYGRQTIEQLLKMQLLSQNKNIWIEEIFGLFSGLAYALARGGRFVDAVVALEHGRARLLNESLQFTRRDLERLPSLGYNDLYQRYLDLKNKYQLINQSSTADPIVNETESLVKVYSNLQEVITLIQKVPNYETFFKLPDFDQIRFTAQEMPIAYLITTDKGALGLIITPQSIKTVWSDISNETIIEWLNQQKDDPYSEGYISGQLGNIALLNTSLENILPKLGEEFIGKIAAEIRSMGLSEFTLIPSGWIGLFPVHAALYIHNGQKSCLLNEFTVHYSPSSQVLQAAKSFLTTKDISQKILAGVGNPLSSYQPLAYGQAELEEITVMFNGNSKTLYKEAAKKANFLEISPLATHIHLACHGNFKPDAPLYSSLLLAEEDVLTLDEILTKPVFTNARLVTLSACQTAIVDYRKLIDESIGFPAGFMQAGVPGVIGTLWSIDDLSTALLMIRFYKFHIKDELSPAESLRKAQLWLRDVTNAELSEFLTDNYLNTQSTEVRTMFEIVNDNVHRYANSSADERPFANPLYWAAFVFYGL